MERVQRPRAILDNTTGASLLHLPAVISLRSCELERGRRGMRRSGTDWSVPARARARAGWRRRWFKTNKHRPQPRSRRLLRFTLALPSVPLLLYSCLWVGIQRELCADKLQLLLDALLDLVGPLRQLR